MPISPLRGIFYMSDSAGVEEKAVAPATHSPRLGRVVEDELALLAAAATGYASPPEPRIDPRYSQFTAHRQAHWDRAAASTRGIRIFRGEYQKRLREAYRQIIPPGKRVLEIGCGCGDLLASLKPSHGVGVDFSGAMLQSARREHPDQTFIQADAHELNLGEAFDYIICADLVDDLWDVQRVFRNAAAHSHPSTRLIVNVYSRVWELPRRLAEHLGLATRLLPQSWLTVEDVINLLCLADFDVIRHYTEILYPFRTPGINAVSNKFLVKLWPFRLLALTNMIIARPRPVPRRKPVVSVVVAARNEAGNIADIFDRVPQMGAGTELIFVEGHSQDNTYEAIQREIERREIERRPYSNAKLFKQPGQGKGDAVRTGFANASGDLLMILDADLTVAPEDLPRFYEAWQSGKADYVNGVRLVYPMEDRAMRFCNMVANRFFGVAFTWLLGQPIKDTLCGTKVLSRRDYEMIAANRAYFGDEDPFGDFDLIFGAAKYNLKFVDIPIRYGERVYGETNIRRWSHGWLLLRMLAKAMHKLKFI